MASSALCSAAPVGGIAEEDQPLVDPWRREASPTMPIRATSAPTAHENNRTKTFLIPRPHIPFRHPPLAPPPPFHLRTTLLRRNTYASQDSMSLEVCPSNNRGLPSGKWCPDLGDRIRRTDSVTPPSLPLSGPGGDHGPLPLPFSFRVCFFFFPYPHYCLKGCVTVLGECGNGWSTNIACS